MFTIFVETDYAPAIKVALLGIFFISPSLTWGLLSCICCSGISMLRFLRFTRTHLKKIKVKKMEKMDNIPSKEGRKSEETDIRQSVESEGDSKGNTSYSSSSYSSSQ